MVSVMEYYLLTQIKGSLLRKHKLLISGVKRLAINQKSKSKNPINCTKLLKFIDVVVIIALRKALHTCRSFKVFYGFLQVSE